MSLDSKLQVLNAEVTQKILDSNFQLDNCKGLLEIANYIKVLISASGNGGNGGGASIDYTELLNTLISTLDSFYIDSGDNQVSGNSLLTSLLAANQVSLSMTATSVTIAALNTPQLLLADNPDRKYLMIQNNSDSGGVTIGFTSGMTALTGMRLPVNAAFEQNSNCVYKGAVYGYKTGGNGVISIIQGV